MKKDFEDLIETFKKQMLEKIIYLERELSAYKEENDFLIEKIRKLDEEKIVKMFSLKDNLGYEEMIKSNMYTEKENDLLRKLIILSFEEKEENYIDFKIKTLKKIDNKILDLINNL